MISRPPSGLSNILDRPHEVKLGLPIVPVGRHDSKNKTSGDFFKRKDNTFHNRANTIHVGGIFENEGSVTQMTPSCNYGE